MKKLIALLITIVVIGGAFAACDVEVKLNESEIEAAKDIINEVILTETTSSREMSTFEEVVEADRQNESEAEIESKPVIDENNMFVNYDINGRWNKDAITVVPVKAYYEGDRFIAHCYIVNGFDTQATFVHIESLTVSGKGGVLIGKGRYANQNLTINAQSYVEHTFSLEGGALAEANANLSELSFSCDFRAYH